MAKTDSDQCATLSVAEAGRLLGLGRNSSYKAARRGELPTLRIGGRILVPREALERMLRETGTPEAQRRHGAPNHAPRD